MSSVPPLSYEQTPKRQERNRTRSKRKLGTRSTTISRIPHYTIKVGRELFPEDVVHPKTRGECVNSDRPCPFAGCKYHLFLDLGSRGSVKMNFPDLELDEIPETCSLDVADRGGETLEKVGDYMNLTRERVRQIENTALDKLKRRLPMLRIP